MRQALRVFLAPLVLGDRLGPLATPGREERTVSPALQGCRGRRVSQASRVSLALRARRVRLPSRGLALPALRVTGAAQG